MRVLNKSTNIVDISGSKLLPGRIQDFNLMGSVIPLKIYMGDGSIFEGKVPTDVDLTVSQDKIVSNLFEVPIYTRNIERYTPMNGGYRIGSIPLTYILIFLVILILCGTLIYYYH